MSENKMKQQINNVVNDNLEALKQLFPSAVKDGQVDFEALKEELGEFEEVKDEKYEFRWAGKQNAKKAAQTDVGNRTLKYIPEDSKDADTTQNLYIEGDNLEVLKLLRQNYYGAIKMIYIDPPYNTGNDFIYDDKFSMSKKESDKLEGIVSEDGERLQKNPKEGNSKYHTNWLNMMYPRLKVARDLLTDDGVIFISIDDNEQANLKKICDEIFGEGNFVADFIRKTKSTTNDAKIGLNYQHEVLYCYSKNRNMINLLGGKKNLDRYTNPDNDPNGDWVSDNPSAKSGNMENNYFSIKNPNTGKKDYPPLGMFWRFSKNTIQRHINNGTICFKKEHKENERGFIYKRYKKNLKTTKKTMDSLLFIENLYMNQAATKELLGIGLVEYFSYPKGIEFIKRMIEHSSESEDIILDFFSGSATTAHAVMKLNSEDNGNRKFIMVQLPEKTDEKSEAFKAGYKNICEIGKERIRRAGEKIKEEVEKENSNLKLGEEPKKVPDIGFKVFRVDDTNIRWKEMEEISETDILSSPDMLDFKIGTKDIDVVYELMLRQPGVPLSETLEKLAEIGNRTYLYADSYLVCLETEITEGIIEKVAEINPLPFRFIFRDSAFGDDIGLKDEIFRRLKSLIEKNFGSGDGYRVEFI